MTHPLPLPGPWPIATSQRGDEQNALAPPRGMTFPGNVLLQVAEVEAKGGIHRWREPARDGEGWPGTNMTWRLGGRHGTCGLFQVTR